MSLGDYSILGEILIDTYLVYLHISPSNKGDVGITKNSKDPNRRWGNGSGYSKNKHFSNAIQRYKWHNFKYIVAMHKGYEAVHIAYGADRHLIKELCEGIGNHKGKYHFRYATPEEIAAHSESKAS